MEIWKDIKEYEGYYQISNYGRVKGLRRWRRAGTNNGGYYTKEKILVCPIRNDGYNSIHIKKKYRKTFLIHRLVAQAFIPNPENKPQVNHKNGIKSDNRVENLEWCTAKENNNHAIKLGLINNDGEKSGTAKLKKEDVLDIRKLSKFLKPKELAIMFNMSYSGILHILRKRTWKHL